MIERGHWGVYQPAKPPKSHSKPQKTLYILGKTIKTIVQNCNQFDSLVLHDKANLRNGSRAVNVLAADKHC